MSIKLKTIHQLQEATSTNDNDLFEVSEQLAGTDRYSSKSMKYSTIKQSLTNSLSSTMVDAFKMKYTDGTNVNISSMWYRTQQIWNDATWNQSDVVTMNKLLKLNGNNTSDVSQISQNQFTTRHNVEMLIENSQTFIGQTSLATANPVTASKVGTNDDSKLMKWKFDDGGNDSSLAKDEYGNLKGNVRCGKTGHLTIYGWLADNGNVNPQEAWVGLFGQVETPDGSQFIPLQVQPWIIGQKSSQLQYIGFNIPVKEGLNLKIRTGFSVNGANTAFNEGNHLVLENIQPNTFVGYIVG